MGFPQIRVIFSKRPAGFRCRKRPFPTFANIWSHCLWALRSAAPVIYLLNFLYSSMEMLLTVQKDYAKYVISCT